MAHHRGAEGQSFKERVREYECVTEEEKPFARLSEQLLKC